MSATTYNAGVKARRATNAAAKKTAAVVATTAVTAAAATAAGVVTAAGVARNGVLAFGHFVKGFVLAKPTKKAEATVELTERQLKAIINAEIRRRARGTK